MTENMTRKELVQLVLLTVVSTLAEEDGGPEGVLYMGLQSRIPELNLEDWQIAVQVMREMELVTSTGFFMKITDKGRAFATKVKDHLRKPDAV
jgi:hypothetical protein